MENMAKGCGRSDAVEGVERRPRIVIPSVESKVDSLTSTTYTSTSYSSTQTFAVGVRRFPFLHACLKCLNNQSTYKPFLPLFDLLPRPTTAPPLDTRALSPVWVSALRNAYDVKHSQKQKLRISVKYNISIKQWWLYFTLPSRDQWPFLVTNRWKKPIEVLRSFEVFGCTFS